MKHSVESLLNLFQGLEVFQSLKFFLDFFSASEYKIFQAPQLSSQVFFEIFRKFFLNLPIQNYPRIFFKFCASCRIFPNFYGFFFSSFKFYLCSLRIISKLFLSCGIFSIIFCSFFWPPKFFSDFFLRFL